VLQVVILNKAMSLIIVISALLFCSGIVSVAELADH